MRHILLLSVSLLCSGCGAIYYAAQPEHTKDDFTDLGMVMNPVAWVVPAPLIPKPTLTQETPNICMEVIKHRNDPPAPATQSYSTHASRDDYDRLVREISVLGAMNTVFSSEKLLGKSSRLVAKYIGQPDAESTDHGHEVLVYRANKSNGVVVEFRLHFPDGKLKSPIEKMEDGQPIQPVAPVQTTDPSS